MTKRRHTTPPPVGEHPTTKHRLRYPPIAVLAAIVLSLTALTGCGSGSSSGSDGSGRTKSAADPAGTPSATTGTAGNSTRQLDVCALVGTAKASQLDGHQITTAGPATGLSSHEYGCAYSNDDGTVQIQIQVFAHDAKSNYDNLSSQSKDVTAVPGLGDKAFYDNDETMYVLAGNNLLQVNGCDGADHCAALARPVLSAL